MSLVAHYGESSSSEDEDQLGDKRQDVRRLLAVLPVKGRNQAVRLGLPKYQTRKDDSEDSDEDSGPTTVMRRKENGGGLTSILPRPKQGSKVMINKSGPGVTPMIPYTLTKRPPPSHKFKRKAGPSDNAKSATFNEDGDSDGESVSFFSHLESSSSTVDFSHHVERNSSVSNDPLNAAPCAPKPFSVGGEGDLTDPTLFLSEESGAYDDATDERPAESAEREGPLLSAAGPGLSMDDQAYRRLTGGKRKRGRDPGLRDLIEIREEDVKTEIETYRKHHSEEDIDRLYKPHDGSAPTGQQKRKHQLTYLAHEAKANELKLLKQWGQSAASRRDTQMKYGF